MIANIVIPDWLSIVDEEFYNTLVRNIEYFNKNNSVDVLTQMAWETAFADLEAAFTTWKTTNRNWSLMIYIYTALGFSSSVFNMVNLIDTEGAVNVKTVPDLPTKFSTVMEDLRFPNIFNFNGAIPASRSWPDSYIWNGGNIANLTALVLQIQGSVAYENATIDTVTHRAIRVLQQDTFDKMIIEDPSKTIYFDYLLAGPMYVLNSEDYQFPELKS